MNQPLKFNKTPLPSNSLFNFHLPDELQCGKPTEVRGIARDEVRLMVSDIGSDDVQHSQFNQLGDFLQEGDVLVVNTSGTLKAALEAKRKDGQQFRVHLSTKLNDDQWVLELRQIQNKGSHRFRGAVAGETLQLSSGGNIQLLRPYYPKKQDSTHLQLWVARFDIEHTIEDYLEKHGQPIRYNHAKALYPSAYYQTTFANTMGSAEMPSAARAFTPKLVSQLVSKGVQVIPILLHTGVASLEIDEKPYEEYYRVSKVAAQWINLARKENRRIIAVGTTVVRALESVTDRFGNVQAGEGWTDLYITPQRGVFAIDGLLTGFHEPRASHLLMLEALAGRAHLQVSYSAAIENAYQWHEFGDLHLMMYQTQ